jgi:hypothetical protein
MGTGTLNIDGGSLSVGGGNGSIGIDKLVLGSAVGTSGSHTLSGTGSILAGNETIGGSGTGTFNQSGGTHTVTNVLTIAAANGSSGTYNLTGGALTANGGITNNAGGSFTVGAGTVAIVGGAGFVNHGLLGGGGTIAGNVTSDGTVGPGYSPGTLSITGNYTQTALGTFNAEIGGLLDGQYDALNVTGTATLDGLLNVSLFESRAGLFTPHAGDYFDILTASTILGSFSSQSFAALSDPNLFWRIDYLTNDSGRIRFDVVRLSVASNIAPPPPPAVPEPETYAMLLAGLGLLGFVGRRKKTA